MVFPVDTERHAGSRVRRESVRAPRTRVRAWTGRATISLVTDSALPTFVLAGTRKSRVSEMRSLVRTDAAPSLTVPFGSATSAFERMSGRAPQSRFAG